MSIALWAQSGRSLPRCDEGNGGLTLPEGFCALVVAESVGRARHLTVADNGDLYVAIRNLADARPHALSRSRRDQRLPPRS